LASLCARGRRASREEGVGGTEQVIDRIEVIGYDAIDHFLRDGHSGLPEVALEMVPVGLADATRCAVLIRMHLDIGGMVAGEGLGNEETVSEVAAGVGH
jgi:hypothetical protein